TSTSRAPASRPAAAGTAGDVVVVAIPIRAYRLRRIAEPRQVADESVGATFLGEMARSSFREPAGVVHCLAEGDPAVG
ncbi:MAG: hypothetical protein SYR96_28010, partial [Actinomycetota bacterium]|nr:hypothetical protein [Actinomycetota bacterium]